VTEIHLGAATGALVVTERPSSRVLWCCASLSRLATIAVFAGLLFGSVVDLAGGRIVLAGMVRQSKTDLTRA